MPGHFYISVRRCYFRQFRQRSASGYAPKRFWGIFASQPEQLPYVPRLMRPRASFMALRRNSYECSTGSRVKYSVTSSASSSRLTFGSSRLYSGNLLSQSPLRLGSFFAKVLSEASKFAFVFSNSSLNFLRSLLVMRHFCPNLRFGRKSERPAPNMLGTLLSCIIAIKKRAANRG